MENTTLIVNGMACAACAMRIEKRLKKVEGISHCAVNLASGRAQVTYDPANIKEETLCQIVDRMGFSAHVAQTGERAKQENPKRLLLEALLSLLLTLPLVLAMLFPHSFLRIGYLQAILALPVQFYFGRRFLKGAYSALRNFSATMDTLVALGTLSAYFYSLILVLIKPSSMFYFESSAMVISFVLLGRALEGFARAKASDAIEGLLKLAPDTCLRVTEEGVQTVSMKEIAIDDVCLVRTGDRIPVDGVLVWGAGSVDTSMLTGESLPLFVEEGHMVNGGTLCVDGSFHVKVTRIGADTALNRIIECTEKAQGSKANVQQLADRVAGVFIPCVLGIALVTLLYTLFLAQLPFAQVLARCVSVLVVACPCALGLATPVAIIAGTGRGASLGILMRDGNALEKLSQVRTVILDKTGTLTKGKMQVESLFHPGCSKETFVSCLKSLEALSTHPLARAIQQLEGEVYPITDFENHPGLGVKGRMGAQTLFCGNRAFMERNELSVSSFETQEKEAKAKGFAVLYLGKDNLVLGLCTLSDTLKEDAAETIEKLHKMHLHTVLLTGDHQNAAQLIADRVGIEKVYAQTLPWDKAEIVQKLSKESRCLMVGDGINDAPAMQSAYASIAMGNGSDIAIEAADAMLVGGSVALLPQTLRLARKSMRIIRENLAWAFCYNILAIPLAALNILPPGLSGAAMAFSSIAVVTNALRLRAFKI